MIREILGQLAAGAELSPDAIATFLAAVEQDSVGEAQIAAFLTGLRIKGASVGETVAISRYLRARCTPVQPRVNAAILDTCGTGGGLSTVNISTASAILCAAAGIPVAKHGSRSLSSLSGSADVLEALGVSLAVPPLACARMIEEIGIAFLHAPAFHPLMRRLLPVELALGFKTIFYTLIGPLINPASARCHLLGVYRPELQTLCAEAVAQLDYERAMIVHGLDGVDEISLLGSTRIHQLEHGQWRSYDLVPEDVGLARCTLEAIRSRTPAENAAQLRAVFAGQQHGAVRDAIVLNTAGALIVGGRASSFADGIALASALLDEGAAHRKLQQLVDSSQDYARRGADGQHG
ncbi:MAG: anthranilate phosphoribosyltransferase [Sphingomonadaceae bacterium]